MDSDRIRAACLACLARREYGSDELKRRLKQQGFEDELVDKVVDELKSEGLQSDARFADAVTRSRAGKGYGLYRIRQELRQRGLDGDEGAELAQVDWDELIFSVHARKFGEGAVPGTPQERAKVERFLMGRGFSGDQIRRLFRRLRDGVAE